MEEIEAKFLDININKLRKLIKKNGGKKIHKMMLYERYVFKLQTGENGYIRTRQENGKVTITIKKYPKDSKYAIESEIEINSSLEEAKNFLLAGGFHIKAYQQTLREKWQINGCPEIAIDTIPGIPTYVELECNNEKEIKRVAKLLELDFNKAEYGAYDKQFLDYYGILRENINQKINSLTFNNIDKELKPYIKINKDLLKKVKQTQLQLILKNKIIIS
jgi:adenylate cyclase class 2